MNHTDNHWGLLSFFQLLLPPKGKSCYLLPPPPPPHVFFRVPGETLQHGSFQQLPPNNRNIVLFFFIFPPLHHSRAITLFYFAYDLVGGRWEAEHIGRGWWCLSTERKSTCCTPRVVLLQLLTFSQCGLYFTLVARPVTRQTGYRKWLKMCYTSCPPPCIYHIGTWGRK